MKKLLRLALFTSALVTALAFTGCDPNVDEPAKKQEDSEKTQSDESENEQEDSGTTTENTVKLVPDGVRYSLEKSFKIEVNKWYLVEGTVQVDEPSYGEINHIDIMETKTYEPFSGEYGLINNWCGRQVSGDDYSFRKIWHVTNAEQAGVHNELFFCPHWKDGDTDEKTKTATANMKVKKIEVTEIELEEELPYYFTVDSFNPNGGEAGGKILDIPPVKLEAGKKYRLSGTIKIGKPEKGMITRISFQDRKVFDCFGNWTILQDYETGLGNKTHNFSAEWIVSNEQAGIHNQVGVNVYWDKNGGDNESVMGSYCFFDLPEFKIEEVIED